MLFFFFFCLSVFAVGARGRARPERALSTAWRTLHKPAPSPEPPPQVSEHKESALTSKRNTGILARS